jgi:hypothetical protein
MTSFVQSEVEEAGLTWLEGLGYAVLRGPHFAPGEPAVERASGDDVIGPEQLLQAVALSLARTLSRLTQPTG